MPISQNPKECGWFYHAPAKKQFGVEKVDYPAPSNIPGLGYDDPKSFEKEEVREMMFRETDSDYIRLAKMGGRKDLLAFTPDRYRNKSDAPKGYPRNEWFYLEDNRLEDEEKKSEEKKEWEFMLPEYMVHKNYKPSFEDPSVTPTRSACPYYTESGSVMKDEGRGATDKTVKIPEVRRPGYGVRNEKPPQAMQKLPARERAIKPTESENWQPGERRRVKNQLVMPTEREDPTNMSKLLAGEYEREWYSKLAEVQSKSEGPPQTRAEEGQASSSHSSSAQKRLLYFHLSFIHSIIHFSAVFGLQFLVVGYMKTIGVFFVEFQRRFASSSSMTSFILGIMELVCSLLSFVVMAGLLKVISPRTACLIGSFFLTVGMAGSAWVTRMEWLCLTQGIFYGTALAFQYMPPFVSLTQYFDKRKALASSISTCGASLGGIVLPLLCRFLFDHFAFEGGVLLTGGILMQAFVFSSLLTPIEQYDKRIESALTERNRAKRDGAGRFLFCFPRDMTEWWRKQCFDCQRSGLLQSASFWVLCMYFFCASIGSGLPQTYIPPLVVERGLTDDDGTLFLSVMNFLDIPARLIPGAILTFHKPGTVNVLIVPLFVVGITGLLVPLLQEYWSFMGMSIVYGIFTGTHFALQPLIVLEMLGQEHFSTAMGFFMICMAMGAAISYPVCGALRDFTGTYKATFVYLGTAEVIAAVTLFLLPLTKPYDTRRGVLSKVH